MELIDTHQHLLLRDKLRYPWADGAGIGGRDYTPADYAAVTAGRGVVSTIFMETAVDDADYRAEARLVAGLIGTGGMLGQIASCRPEIDAGFDDWLAECRGLGVVGFRRILHTVDPGISQSETFRTNLRKIGAAGYPFDICVFARQHPLAEDLLRGCSDQPFVLDHFGNPDIAGDGFAAWAAGLTRLASYPNLSVKFSGITVNARRDQLTVATLQPYADHLLACFGPQRIVWGGDWPVCDLGSGLPGWIDLTHGLLAGLTEAERHAIGVGTALRIYRVSPPEITP